MSKDEVVDLAASGKLRTFGGKPSNPFFRSADVAALAQELGIGDLHEPKRVKSASARVHARLTADSRWAEVSDEDISQWAARADDSRRQAGRKVAVAARKRLETVLKALDQHE